MAPPSIFTRPKRQIAATVGTAQRRIEVASENELLAAIGRLTAAFVSIECGAEIVIIQSFTITRSVIIPATLKGLIISSNGFVKTNVASDVVNAIDVRGLPFAARGLYLVGSQAGSADTVGVLCSASLTVADQANYFSVEDCRLEGFDFPAYSLLTTGPQFLSTTFTRLTIRGSSPVLVPGGYSPEVSFCRAARPLLDLFSIETDSDAARIVHNSLGREGNITILAGGGDCAIIGNDALGGIITTTASSGSNTVQGNRLFGAYTLHASDDATGGNT